MDESKRGVSRQPRSCSRPTSTLYPSSIGAQAHPCQLHREQASLQHALKLFLQAILVIKASPKLHLAAALSETQEGTHRTAVGMRATAAEP